MNAKLARQLADLGASPEVIGVAIEAVTLASRDASRFVTVPNVTPAAARARRYRQNLKQKQALAEANDAAKTGAEQRDGERDASRDGVTPRCDLLGLSRKDSVEAEAKTESKKTRSENAGARGSRMQSGAALIEEFRQAAIDLGADPARVPDMWAEFVDYWVGIPGQRGLKTDWLATWRNRVRDVLSRGPRNGARTHHTPQPRRSGADDFFAGLASVAADIDRDGAMAGPADADIPRGRFNLDG